MRFEDRDLKLLWEEVICCECGSNAPGEMRQPQITLSVVSLYRHIRFVMQLLEERPSPDLLREKLNYRKTLYE